MERSKLVVAAGALLATAVVAGCASSASSERGQSSSGSTASAKAVLEDAALTARVKTALTAAGAGSVHVTTTQGGIVQLSGFVQNSEEARRAEDIARRVQGVKQVYDDIRVAPRA